ncbi:hypothetical protein ACN267_31090 [Micromonospora sp. WMMD734]|uniref:hypothetical protein n=1 Tax=Micromonospora sp. WMMD734 TaxID=3404129 RepID=UPI003B962024
MADPARWSDLAGLVDRGWLIRPAGLVALAGWSDLAELVDPACRSVAGLVDAADGLTWSGWSARRLDICGGCRYTPTTDKFVMQPPSTVRDLKGNLRRFVNVIRSKGR